MIISTGKTDWENEVTEAEGTLAALLNAANSSLGPSKKPKPTNDSLPPGLFSHAKAGRLAILNGSHKTFSRDESEETVIVLPDFMVVSGVPRTLAGAEALWKAAIDPAIDRAGVTNQTDDLNTWVLPYSCLILLCEFYKTRMLIYISQVPSGSHKRRDKRCAVAAPILEKSKFANSFIALYSRLRQPSINISSERAGKSTPTCTILRPSPPSSHRLAQPPRKDN